MDTSVHELIELSFILFHRDIGSGVPFRVVMYTSERHLCASTQVDD